VLNEIYDLFIDLDADESQLDFPVLYAVAKNGTASLDPAVHGVDLQPLFETIVSTIPAATGDADGTLQILVTNLDYSEYFGRIAICRVFQGTLHAGDDVTISKRDGSLQKTRITKLFTFSGLKRIETTETTMGDIVAVAGVEGITIGETITSVENPAPLPLIVIDEPTIAIQFSVNNSPFAGREGQYVTSRNLRERLEKELLTNVSIRVEDTGSPDTFKVLGRGELQLAILIEMMRREGFELSAGRPEIVTKTVDGTRMEPVEHLTIDVPEAHTGVVIEKLGPRKGEMTKMHNHGSGRVRMEFRVPSRGLIGLRSEMLTETRGTIVMNALFDGYIPYMGEIPQRPTGALISDRQGLTTTYSLNGLQERRRALARQRSRRERGPRKEDDQHARLKRGRGHPLGACESAQPGAGHRVHRRGRDGRGHAQVAAAAQEGLAAKPQAQAVGKGRVTDREKAYSFERARL